MELTELGTIERLRSERGVWTVRLTEKEEGIEENWMPEGIPVSKEETGETQITEGDGKETNVTAAVPKECGE